MEIKVNKEIRNYTESIFFGLSLRQCFFSFTACAIAVGVYFLAAYQIGVEITSWLCMLSAFPFAMLGFVTFQGMNAEYILVVAIRSLILTHTKLEDRPFNLYKEIFKDLLTKKRLEGLGKHDQKLFKIKKAK